MNLTVEHFNEQVKEIAPVLISVFDLDKSELEYGIPEVVSLEEFEAEVPAAKDFEIDIAYNGFGNIFVVDEEADRFDEEEFTPIIGEETAHC